MRKLAPKNASGKLYGGGLRIVRAGPGVTLAELINRDDAAAAAVVKLFRDSASPAANDVLFAMEFFGRDSGASEQQYAGVEAIITDPAAASEDGNLRLKTAVGGTFGNRMHVGAGMWMEGAAGSDPGAGQINATAYKLDNVALPFTKRFASSNQTITSAGSLTLAHGLSATPTLVYSYLVCTTAELNYSVNDIAYVQFGDGNTAGASGHIVVPDATNLNVRYSSNAPVYQILNKTTGAVTGITHANWRAVFVGCV